MAHWVFIEEGTYAVEEAFLMTPGYTALALEDPVIEIYLDSAQERRVRGHAMVVNLLMVELLEDHDEIDMLLDLGNEFKYLIKEPMIRSGKVFSPDVKSLMQFMPNGPLQKLSVSEYSDLRSRLSVLGPPS